MLGDHHQKKVDSTFLVGESVSRFSCQYSNIPPFHYSMRLTKRIAAKNTVILSEAQALRAGGQ